MSISICKMDPRLKALLAIPRIEQKTTEWYAARHNVISASDFAQALGEGKFGTQRQLIEKKLLTVEQAIQEGSNISNPFFKWGHTYEPVASKIYSLLHENVKIYEFGLIRHPTLNFLSASPDGITEACVMVEIKCPMKRRIIKDDIPLQYYYQMQAQLEVCGLDYCDYIECSFEECATMDDFKKFEGIKGARTKDGQLSPILPYDTFKVFEDWLVSQESTATLWILKDYQVKRVKKDEIFLTEKLKELKDVWDQILYYRANPEAYELERKIQSLTIETERLSEAVQLPSCAFR
jgi:putative phage-type endonuclease